MDLPRDSTTARPMSPEDRLRVRSAPTRRIALLIMGRLLSLPEAYDKRFRSTFQSRSVRGILYRTRESRWSMRLCRCRIRPAQGDAALHDDGKSSNVVRGWRGREIIGASG